MTSPNRHTALARLGGTPRRRSYTGGDLNRVKAIEDLRAGAQADAWFRAEILDGGPENKATLTREREVFAEWRFVPRQLVDVSHRTLEIPILDRAAIMPLVLAPSGLNGLFRPGGT